MKLSHTACDWIISETNVEFCELTLGQRIFAILNDDEDDEDDEDEDVI